MSRRITHFETHGKVVLAPRSMVLVRDLGGQMFVFRRHYQETGQMQCKFVKCPL